MAVGKPVVATRVGGVAEAVEEGVSGYLVESDDCKALVERLLELLNDGEKALRFGEAGRKIASAKFTAEVRRNKMLLIYKRLVKEKFPLSSAETTKVPHQLI
jgi:glycosyltransferase involved in cell wall biosynthesis